MSIEVETARVACQTLTEPDFAALDAIIDQQGRAVAARDPAAFHDLDDQFHREICERSGTGFAWEIAREMKSHMDRVRYLSLPFASEHAYLEHKDILAAIRSRNEEQAATTVRKHLTRILEQIVQIRAEHASYFVEEK
jgi:DNA-binding GntR family transcriptional regulator